MLNFNLLTFREALYQPRHLQENNVWSVSEKHSFYYSFKTLLQLPKNYPVVVQPEQFASPAISNIFVEKTDR